MCDTKCFLSIFRQWNDCIIGALLDNDDNTSETNEQNSDNDENDENDENVENVDVDEISEINDDDDLKLDTLAFMTRASTR